MKRGIVVALTAAVLALAMAGAPAYAAQLISLGVTSVDGESLTYGYGELDLGPALALGVEYRSDEALSISLWHGVSQGLYGEIEVKTSDDDSKQLIEVGLWRTVPVSSTIDLSGWIGAQGELGGSGVWVKASAELAISLTDAVALFVGGDTTLLKKDIVTSTYAGVGYSF